MRFVALATDYDGTLARHGLVAPATVRALKALRESGRTLILVTGRELPQLRTLFPEIDLFECVVAENGAMLWWPKTGKTDVLAEPPPNAFVAALRAEGVEPLSVGEAIVATMHPHETVVLETIRHFGLELQVIFNKGAVMVLPSGVNKASGLTAALSALGLSPRNVVAVGDAENDHTMLDLAECGTAVANAVPMLKRTADMVMQNTHGEGVVELVEKMLADDLADLDSVAARRTLTLGESDNGAEEISAAPSRLLVVGSDIDAAAAYAVGLVKALIDHGYQCCVVDASGAFRELDGAIPFSATDAASELDAVVKALANPGAVANVSVASMSSGARNEFLAALLSRLRGLRKTRGRPHWIVVGAAEEVSGKVETVPADAVADGVGVLMVSTHPDEIPRALLVDLDVVAAVGGDATETLQRVSRALDVPLREVRAGGSADALIWFPREVDEARALRPVQVPPTSQSPRRARPDYFEGELPVERSFHFRGPANRLNLRAQNLALFVQIADGIDDHTWVHHLRSHDYSRWMCESLEDEGLADTVHMIESDESLDPQESRQRVRTAIEASRPAAAP